MGSNLASNPFKKAIKQNAKLRLALCGVTGSGKTFTSLRIATGLGGRTAFVDTEHGSASKYAHTRSCGGPGVCTDPSHFEFDVIEPSTFDPRELMKFIDAAIENGYSNFISDSLSHYWMGVGGELEMVDNVAKQAAARSGREGNSFTAWKTVTPIHNQLVDKLISAPIHIICCLRKKTEWVIEKDEKGRSVPRKVGMENVMRDGIEYEFDICGDLDQDNNLVVTKSRCHSLSGKVINRPGADVAKVLHAWLASDPETAGNPHPEPQSTPAQQGSTAQTQGAGGRGNQPSPAPQAPAGNGGTPQPSSQGQKGQGTSKDQGAGHPQENPAPTDSTLPPALAEAIKQLRAADKYGKLKAFADLKKDIEEITGADLAYYEILGKHIPKERWRNGSPHADGFAKLGDLVKAFAELWSYCSEVSAAVNTPPADEPAGPTSTMSADAFVEGLEPEVAHAGN